MDGILASIAAIPDLAHYGRVVGVQGLLVEVAGAERRLAIGAHAELENRDGARIPAEVVGFARARALLMPYGQLDGVGIGCKAHVGELSPSVHPAASWLGRVIDARGNAIDGGPPLERGDQPFALRSAPPPAHQRARVGGKIDLGVRALNTFVTCCRGQRMGIFAGSGVGKSVMMSMIARYTSADVNVIGLIGERGREVQEFLDETLGPEGRARSVVIVATSDEPALLRRQAAWMTMAVAEFFRDQGKDVLCLMDSVTRFAMAQREVGLSCGEPPTTKGYPPTVFAELPRLLERAGPGPRGSGSITGLFTVLVEGDDHNEPIADAVRGILDGHIVLERGIAERGRYPAVNVLRSVSRTMPACNDTRENELVRRARTLLSTYEDMAELIRLGAYKRGADPAVDEAIAYNAPLEAFLNQGRTERADLASCYAGLARILDAPAREAA